MVELRHGRDYFSPSQLKKLFVSVSSLTSYLKKKWATTSSMTLGTLVHCLILEPEEFSKRYIILDDRDVCKEIGGARPSSTKKYKDWLSAVAEDNKGKEFVSMKDMAIANKILKKCKDTGIIDEWFTDGKAEVTVKGVAKGYDDEFDGLCIIDYDTDFVSIDLKTTSKPLSKFKYDANELGYDIQASITNSLNSKEFIFVVVQTVEPYDIGIYTCSEFFMNRGREKVNTALNNYKFYEDENSSQVFNYEL
tara:strand:+ start:3982 stop:4731 length:750 start_codon:yes stop_codon:yes gene_type:complete